MADALANALKDAAARGLSDSEILATVTPRLRAEATAKLARIRSATRLKRREKGYLAKVEGELFAIYRMAKPMSDDKADPTPTDMHEIMATALRALRLLGWEPTVTTEKRSD